MQRKERDELLNLAVLLVKRCGSQSFTAAEVAEARADNITIAYDNGGLHVALAKDVGVRSLWDK